MLSSEQHNLRASYCTIVWKLGTKCASGHIRNKIWFTMHRSADCRFTMKCLIPLISVAWFYIQAYSNVSAFNVFLFPLNILVFSVLNHQNQTTVQLGLKFKYVLNILLLCLFNLVLGMKNTFFSYISMGLSMWNVNESLNLPTVVPTSKSKGFKPRSTAKGKVKAAITNIFYNTILSNWNVRTVWKESLVVMSLQLPLGFMELCSEFQPVAMPSSPQLCCCGVLSTLSYYSIDSGSSRKVDNTVHCSASNSRQTQFETSWWTLCRRLKISVTSWIFQIYLTHSLTITSHPSIFLSFQQSNSDWIFGSVNLTTG